LKYLPPGTPIPIKTALPGAKTVKPGGCLIAAILIVLMLGVGSGAKYIADVLDPPRKIESATP